MADTATLKQRLGLSDAPIPGAGLATAVHFFERVLNADPLYWWEYLRGIDFHQRVNIKRLPKHTRLVRYDFADPGPRRELPPFAFFTDAGSSPFHTGTSWPAYFYKEYNVVDETLALVSIASTISWLPDKEKRRFDRVHRPGGAVQYIIQRVKNRMMLVWVRSVGSNLSASAWVKSRVWSSSITTMTMPRRRSGASKRTAGARLGADRGRTGTATSMLRVMCIIIIVTIDGCRMSMESARSRQIDVCRPTINNRQVVGCEPGESP